MLDQEIGAVLTAAATRVVAAVARSHRLGADEVPRLVAAVARALAGAGEAEPADRPAPAADLRRLVRADAVVCAECGRSGKTMRRHLRAEHGLTPEAYRIRWNLAHDHPIVAPSYSTRRADLARAIGLGSNRAVAGGRRAGR